MSLFRYGSCRNLNAHACQSENIIGFALISSAELCRNLASRRRNRGCFLRYIHCKRLTSGIRRECRNIRICHYAVSYNIKIIYFCVRICFRLADLVRKHIFQPRQCRIRIRNKFEIIFIIKACDFHRTCSASRHINYIRRRLYGAVRSGIVRCIFICVISDSRKHDSIFSAGRCEALGIRHFNILLIFQC